MKYKGTLFDLSGKVAVVTGGLGTLGTEYVRTLVAAGARVAVLDIKSFSKHHVLRRCSLRSVRWYRVDVSVKRQVQQACTRICDELGIPSILINNAALDFPPTKKGKTFEDYPRAELDAVMNVNVSGTLTCCQVFGEIMAQRGCGSIINISSTYGLVSPDQRIYSKFIKPVSYSVSKSAILNLTRYLATYWGGKGVRVNTLTPGGVFNNQPGHFVKKYNEKTPLGRMAHKNEYNGAILFLASDASSYMTGANIIIDGGWTAW